MTAEQQQLLVFLGQHNKAAIRGVAGSGKTILALAKAQETARNGKRTLFLCYNRLLKDWLEKAIPDSFEDLLVIDNFHVKYIFLAPLKANSPLVIDSHTMLSLSFTFQWF